MPDDQIDPTTTPAAAGDAGPSAPSEATASEPATSSGEDAPAPAKRAARKTATKTAAKKATAKTATAKKATAKATTAKKTTAKRTTKKAAAAAEAAGTAEAAEAPAQPPTETPAPDAGATAAPAAEETAAPAKKTATRKTAAKRTTKKAPARKKAGAEEPAADAAPVNAETAAPEAVVETAAATEAPAAEAADAPAGAVAPLFQPPVAKKAPARRTRKTAAQKRAEAEAAAAAAAAELEDAEETAEGETALEVTGAETATEPTETPAATEAAEATETAEGAEQATEGEDASDEQAEDQRESDSDGDSEGGGRRRRRRGGRRRRKSGDGSAQDGDSAAGDAESGDQGESTDRSAEQAEGEDADASTDTGPDEQGGGSSSRRRRRRRRSSDDGPDSGDDPENTVTRVRKPRSAEDEITAISGSTRLEAKKQRRRDGREAGRRRAPIVSEAEFLARREAVDRVMVIRQREDLTQIGVLEDKVLVEHYVARESQTSIIGNVYLGRVQNVLPSMEAAFIDIGKGRNAVLYAGEVNWSALGHRDGQPRKIESVLSSGQSVLVQVTKDPIGHKGARLTSQVSLAGRFLVYVPDGTTSGISRKLPDTERARLKSLLKEIVPESAGVIVRTAAEGASEEELTHDVERLKARWEAIEAKAANKSSAPQLLYGEPDLTLKVVRDLFTEDFSSLVIQGGEAWETVQSYVADVAPDLAPRLERYFPEAHGGKDIFAEYRVEEQIAKALDRKVWLPSGGSLVIDRTEAMTVVDVNTGKFTGSGGNLEETVTKNNLEAAEEVVRQLRLRDIGGIIVVDFIDMVLESNRDLVLRRLVECLGRDRTRHQVAEVTSLGLVQMTRKRIGTGLVEAFSENCEHCHGRGVVIQDQPVEPRRSDDDGRGRTGRKRGGKGRGGEDGGSDSGAQGSRQSAPAPTPKDVAAMARPETAEGTETPADVAPVAEEQTSSPEAPSEAATAAQEAPQVTQRTRRERRPRERRETAASTQHTEQPAESTERAAEPVVESVAPAAPEQQAPAEAPAPVEPAAPKVVTRTRRRSATRPAGSPVTVTTPVAPIIAADPAPLPTAAAAGTPEPPKVVTRTRTRTATRPAGPPSEAPAGSTDGDGGEDGDGPSVEHVPVKKKGTRKR
ncbi:Rne/Rng family ribonuclease [Nocardioides sp. zg-DK7169]|uniref:Rne/Rng family ribonuclease n=1 Tax=Nocardioides sp. zg-DK7169 TaxID=2736600 RepID=UPI001557BBD1|nr:Rne/Rng family ribonuclease [Nocardioides sp. zg-DK7169]NPC97712.1 ribonuclease E/G [Nocardioides sp. zg-DK7169]